GGRQGLPRARPCVPIVTRSARPGRRQLTGSAVPSTPGGGWNTITPPLEGEGSAFQAADGVGFRKALVRARHGLSVLRAPEAPPRPAAEQRPQAFDHPLARDAVLKHLSRDLEAATEVDQGVAGHDRTHALDPEHKVVVRSSGKCLDADGKPVTRSV